MTGRTLACAAAVAAVVVGCRFDGPPGGATFLCGDASNLCPAGETCVGGQCVAELPDAAAVDAPTVPDAPAVDGAPIDAVADICEAANNWPDNDDCVTDALAVTDQARAGITVYGDTADYDDDMSSPPSQPSCLGVITGGRDAFYELELVSGDSLTATISADWDAALYLTNGCSAGAGCLAAANESSVGGAEELSYSATADETVYLVVDATTTPSSGCYALELQIQ